jgi:hypothetical protein
MANPDSTVLLTRALDICSSIVNLQIGPSTLQGEARELMGLLAQFKPLIPEPDTRCGCGRGAVRLRDGHPVCYSCWMGVSQPSRLDRAWLKDSARAESNPEANCRLTVVRSR